ncbi:MAG: hypothetical protein JWN64_32 [Parcubacteria group bacterium]|nr:hypothetical protein [Parcubacteria group bacterium]
METAVEVIETRPGIELHMAQTEIDNPSVFARWCFSPEILERMKLGLSKGYGYAVVMQARLDGDSWPYAKTFRELKQPFQGGTYIEFPCAGSWEVGLYLFERMHVDAGRDTSKELEEALGNCFLKKDNGGYAITLPSASKVWTGLSLDTEGVPRKTEQEKAGKEVVRINSNYFLSGYAIATHGVPVDVPKEIFAAPPSKATLAYTNYFFRNKMDDECDLRWRLLIMVPGFFPWILWEFVKRFFQVIFGVLCLLLGFVSGPEIFGRAFVPRIAFRVNMGSSELNENYNPELWKIFRRPGGIWYTPLFLLIYAGLIKLLLLGKQFVLPSVIIAAQRAVPHHDNRYLLGGLIGAIIGLLIFMQSKNIKEAIMEHLEATAPQRDKRRWERRNRRTNIAKERTLAIGKLKAELVARNAESLVCGTVQAHVSLKALPVELRTFDLRFSDLKRKVCRPFG